MVTFAKRFPYVNIPKREPSGNPKLEWIMNRLIRRGYGLFNQGADHWHFDLEPPDNTTPTYDACNLIVSISPKGHEATFRLQGNSDIHITRYLNLGRMEGWDKLEEFERLYHKMHAKSVHQLTHRSHRKPKNQEKRSQDEVDWDWENRDNFQAHR